MAVQGAASVEAQCAERMALLVLLRSGLWEREPDDLGCFPLSDESWGRLYRLARQQTVTGVVFRGLQHLPDELLPPGPLLLRWAAEVDAIERRNRAVDAAVAELCSKFRANGLEPVLQKGQGVALCYADPALRESGDIDFCFAGSRSFAAAAACARQMGIEASSHADGSLHYRWRGVDVEHHNRLLDLHNPLLRGYAESLVDRWGYSSVGLHSVPGSDVSIPSRRLCLLLLNLHILKHVVGRGIGLRQLCDMARACHVFHDGDSSAEMEQVAGRLGIGRWSALLHSFLVDCLGLSPSCLPYSARAGSAASLSAIVWAGGNFGHYSPTGRMSSGSPWKCRTAVAWVLSTRIISLIESSRKVTRPLFRNAPTTFFGVVAHRAALAGRSKRGERSGCLASRGNVQVIEVVGRVRARYNDGIGVEFDDATADLPVGFYRGVDLALPAVSDGGNDEGWMRDGKRCKYRHDDLLSEPPRPWARARQCFT